MLRIRVVGLGEIGLRVALNAVRAGCEVLGVENNPARIAELTAAGARFEISPVIGPGTFDATLVCVPTWDFGDGIDMTDVLDVAQQLATVASEGELIAIESTVCIRAASTLIKPIFERNNAIVGRDVFIVSSPERIDVTLEWDQRDIPKIVGGVTPRCTERGIEIYTQLGLKPVPVRSSVIAEAAKLLENSFRLVNISFINEVADILSANDVDYVDVISAAATKPFGFMPFWPGAGAGGYCVPSAARALAATAKSSEVVAPTLSAANRTNALASQRVEREMRRKGLLDRQAVLVLGATYKSYASSFTESPGINLANYLARRAYEVTICSGAQPPKRSLRSGVTYAKPTDVEGGFAAVCITSWEPAFEATLRRIENAIVLDFARFASPGLT